MIITTSKTKIVLYKYMLKDVKNEKLLQVAKTNNALPKEVFVRASII